MAKPRQKTRRGWLVPVLATVVAASVLVVAFLYLMYFRRGSNLAVVSQAVPAQADAKAQLGLAVERRGNDLRVSWDGKADLIAKADFGMLLIRGSAVSRDVPLSAEELRSGSVIYASPVDEVRFQLNVVSGERVTREFLTVVLPKGAEPRPIQVSSKSGASHAGGQPQPPVLSVSVPLQELRQFKPVEPRVPATVAPLRIEEPPVAGAAPVSTPTSALLNQPQVSLPAPVEAPPQRIPQAEPQTSTAGARPPVATNQVIPQGPTLLRGVPWKAVVVDVNVSVDEAGSVVKAEAVAKPGLHPLLRDAAVQAARRWKFRPAQFDGHPVPANIVLQFNFGAKK